MVNYNDPTLREDIKKAMEKAGIRNEDEVFMEEIRKKYGFDKQDNSEINRVQEIPINQQISPWYRKTYDKVYNEASKLQNAQINDKYKHSVISCIGAQDGIYGATVTGIMGLSKEAKDIITKIPKQWKGIQDYGGYSAIFNDSIQDLNANIRGLYTGYNNKDGNCYNLIKPYYKP